MIEIIVQVLKRLLPDLYYEKIKQSYHKFRNHFGFPVSFTDQKYAKYPMTISDAFLWRTDNGYKTKFKYSDILDLFYKIKNSWVEFHFYSKNNELIKIEKIDKLNLSNELEITSKYLNNLEDYGVFYIYHFSDNTDSLNDQDIIINRCYVGYSKNDCLYSFVHGNVFAKFTSISGDGKILSDIIKTSFFKNKKYTIQKYFHDYDRNELFFINPTSNTIKFSLENKNFKLKPGATLLVNISSSIISINSNCTLFRPTVFSYRGQYLDAHHS